MGRGKKMILSAFLCILFTAPLAQANRLFMVTSGDSTGQRLDLHIRGQATPISLLSKTPGQYIRGLVADGDSTTPLYAFVENGSDVDLVIWDRSGNPLGTFPIDLGVTAAVGDLSFGQIVFIADEVDEGTEFKDVWTVDTSTGQINLLGQSAFFYADTTVGETLTELKSVAVDESSGEVFVAVDVSKASDPGGCFSRIVKLEPGLGSTVTEQSGLEFCNLRSIVHDPFSGEVTGTNTIYVADANIVREIQIDEATNSVDAEDSLFGALPGTELSSMSQSVYVNAANTLYIMERDPLFQSATVFEVDLTQSNILVELYLPPLSGSERYETIAVPEPSKSALLAAGASGLAFLEWMAPRIAAFVAALLMKKPAGSRIH